MGKCKQMSESSSHLQHTNFMYQSAHLALMKGQHSMSDYYTSMVMSIARKSLFKIDPQMKRGVCKGCDRLMVPGMTAQVRIIKKPLKYIQLKCLQCFTVKKFPMVRNYRPQFHKLETNLSEHEKCKSEETPISGSTHIKTSTSSGTETKDVNNTS
ncbi:hypothetical protein C0J52_04043 [Blattella germanica]|nr:hypothetical protein C0J52_04043 [Blattella germanica]